MFYIPLLKNFTPHPEFQMLLHHQLPSLGLSSAPIPFGLEISIGLTVKLTKPHIGLIFLPLFPISLSSSAHHSPSGKGTLSPISPTRDLGGGGGVGGWEPRLVSHFPIYFRLQQWLTDFSDICCIILRPMGRHCLNLVVMTLSELSPWEEELKILQATRRVRWGSMTSTERLSHVPKGTPLGGALNWVECRSSGSRVCLNHYML